MTKERELLRRTLEVWDDDLILEDALALMKEIRTYLSTPSDDAEEPEQHQPWCASLTQILLSLPPQIPPCNCKAPKPAEPEAETIETLQAENFKLASGQCTEGGPWGDEGGTPYCKYTNPAEPARKPMTSEEMMKQYEIDKEYFGESVMRAFYNGIRFAEKHHDIGDKDEN